ncbi:NlpC/P60 family protein [Paucihalobacter ruber]|uniref:NlpC/P60 family protein n=1 Tax=Paucihalobacter ruber TaxID=2567861 RepID=A0A506PEP9_9FLAO|nr:C40 family peptidase [Paucihalobacter ruber]TPV31522.1 NlpC/P60 family protein [Paucihalobacter ruber]
MSHGIGNLGVVPMRLEPSDTSEMVSQLIYGDIFKIIDTRKNWIKIRLDFDRYEGWIDKKQYLPISEEDFAGLSSQPIISNNDLIEFVSDENNSLITIPFGATLNGLDILKHHFEGHQTAGITEKSQLINTALTYVNSPYLWGGKTPFGIDCSGFTQMVYKINGYKILRDASQQATMGEALSFIEESEPGDLAFFDNAEGVITHVGIIMHDHYIIHAHGKVRVDRIDHTGIFNTELKQYTHKLRVIKKLI